MDTIRCLVDNDNDAKLLDKILPFYSLPVSDRGKGNKAYVYFEKWTGRYRWHWKQSTIQPSDGRTTVSVKTFIQRHLGSVSLDLGVLGGSCEE